MRINVTPFLVFGVALLGSSGAARAATTPQMQGSQYGAPRNGAVIYHRHGASRYAPDRHAQAQRSEIYPGDSGPGPSGSNGAEPGYKAPPSSTMR